VIFDLQASLAGKRVEPTARCACDLVGQLANDCLVWSVRSANAANAARDRYQQRAMQPTLSLPADLRIDEAPTHLLPGWLVLRIDFELKAPWYSKDDRPLHVLDNPVRKDRVFGVPFMAASSWKGLLRWSCRMEHGLLDHLAKHDGKVDGWTDPPWIVHLFGNTKGEEEEFSRGALQCFPTWFDKVGFEVINPHDRARRAGTQPIVYEVVPPGRKATLHLLYAPAPGRAETQQVDSADAVGRLLDGAQKLLTVYGFSAKRTAGWGIAEIQSGEIRSKRGSRSGTVDELKAAVGELIGAPGGGGA
jgi:CRISPR-associated protein Cmr2